MKREDYRPPGCILQSSRKGDAIRGEKIHLEDMDLVPRFSKASLEPSPPEMKQAKTGDKAFLAPLPALVGFPADFNSGKHLEDYWALD